MFLLFNVLFLSATFAPPLGVADKPIVKVAVIDTGFDFKSEWKDAGKFGLEKPKICENGHVDATEKGLQDVHGHGTNIVSLIANNASDSDYCILVYKFYHSHNNRANTTGLIRSATKAKVTIINFSAGGEGIDHAECAAVKEALDSGIIFIASAGNESSDLKDRPFYPAMCDPRVVVVENTNIDGKRHSKSNYGKDTVKEDGVKVLGLFLNNEYRDMTGTSQAAAIVTGKKVKELHEKDGRSAKKTFDAKAKE